MADPSLPPLPGKTDSPPAETRILSEALQQIADRPHHWTMGVSVAALLVSSLASYFAWRSSNSADRSSNFAELQYKLALNVRDDTKAAVRKQLDDIERSRKAAEKSADAANTSATVAQRQLQTTIDQFHIDQRARVDFVGISRLSDFAAGKPISYRVGVRNVGKTTALRVEFRAWATKAAAFTPTYRMGDGKDELSVLDLGAGSTASVEKNLTLAQKDIEDVTGGRARIFVFGWVKYRDVFDSATVRLTEFCHFYPGASRRDENSFAACATHNSSN